MVKKKTIEEKNRIYFYSLANSRASLTQLRIALISGLPLGLFLTWILSQASIYANIVEFKSLVNIFIVLTVITGMIGICSLSNKLLYKFQIFFSFVLCILVIILTIFVLMLSYLITIYIEANTMFSPSSFYGMIISSLSVATCIVSTVINIFLLHHRLKVGFSETRTSKNILAISGAYSSKALGIIFAAVVILPNILTQGKYLMNIFGIICVLGFSAIFPSPIVEFSYLAYLKSKDKTFWEEQPKIMPIKLGEKKKLRNKLIIGLYIVLSILYFYLIDNIYGDQTYPPLIRIFGLLILISYVVLLIAWIIRKIKERRNK